MALLETDVKARHDHDIARKQNKVEGREGRAELERRMEGEEATHAGGSA
jgi:hypothetical protein